MKLLFKQRLFSWFDSYDIYDEAGNTVFTVEGKLSWGHCLHINDAAGKHIGTVKQVILTLLPRFDIYLGDECVGSIKKELTFFKPRFTLDFIGWSVDGNWFEWDYTICDSHGNTVAVVNKEPLNWTDTYSIDISNPDNALAALMVVLAIDAEKCSRD